MITYNDKKFSAWNDVVEKYPAMWVVFDKAEIKKGQVQSGNIMSILPDEEIIEFRHIHHGEIQISLRTTETARITDEKEKMAEKGGGNTGGGYIHGEIINT